jgi:hypothetical protein
MTLLGKKTGSLKHTCVVGAVMTFLGKKTSSLEHTCELVL